MDLSLLASQHHCSEYNRCKYGPNGCPLPYLPLSLNLPDHFHHLRQQQLLLSQRPLWYSSPPPDTSFSPVQDDLFAAIADSFLVPSPSGSGFSIKTSLSHPINISSIIPPDLVSLISSHALLSSSPDAPTLLEIPPSFSLLRLSRLRDARLHPPQHSPLFVQPLSSLPPCLPTRTRTHVADALQAAINTNIDKNHPTASEHIITGFIPESNVSLSLSVKVPVPQPMSLGMPITHSYHQMSFSRQTQPPYFLSSEMTHTTAPASAESTFVIGNLFLSSCPGKKVRLDGPVKGRNGVCRDVEIDMKRMKALGVRCIVCCLDDAELEFLGTPWPEYEQSANRTGIDILRLPIPEGLPPISPEFLDAHLVELIHRYSLRGIPVLVHCRGGVGRAGVVACCWMIRLGLCGSLNQSFEFPTSELKLKPEPSDQDLFSFVQTVISLIRRRRSMKAIETYEQVQFLVDYVRYLSYGPRIHQDLSIDISS